LDLPKYESEHLARSPLVLVAAQINFEEIGREVAHAQARAIQKSVGGHWTHLMSTPLISATMTDTGAVNERPRQAYRLSNEGGTWSALLNPDSVTIETRAYPGWQGLREQIAGFAAAVAEEYDPSSELRLGLRYVDQIALPDERDGWEGLIPEAVLGIATDSRLGSGVLASDQRVLLQASDSARCLMRHGLLADATGAFGKVYLLDFDVYRESSGSYDAQSVAEGADALHDIAGALFCASITDELLTWLRG